MKASRVFFLSAVFVGVLWGSVEVYLFLASRPFTEVTCSWTREDPLEIRNHQLLGAHQSQGQTRILTYDEGDEAIESFKLIDHFENENPKLALRCQKPGYHCFAQKNQLGFDSLSVTFAAQGMFLVQGEGPNQRRSLFPAMLSPQGLQLSDPLKVCGKVPSQETSTYFRSGNRLMIFDPQSSRLAVWDKFSYSGTTTASAAREPDQIYVVSGPSGLVEGSCNQGVRGTSGQVAMTGSLAAVQWLESQQSKVSVFQTEPGLGPEPSYDLGDVGDQLKALGNDDFIALINTPKNRIRILKPSSTEFAQFDEESYSEVPKEPMFELARAGGGLGSLSARFFWRGLQPRLHDSQSAINLPYLPGFWRVQKIPKFFVQSREVDGNIQGFWGWQQGSSISALPFVCKNQTLKNP